MEGITHQIYLLNMKLATKYLTLITSEPNNILIHNICLAAEPKAISSKTLQDWIDKKSIRLTQYGILTVLSKHFNVPVDKLIETT